jgi:hypothetical protein
MVSSIIETSQVSRKEKIIECIESLGYAIDNLDFVFDEVFFSENPGLEKKDNKKYLSYYELLDDLPNRIIGFREKILSIENKIRGLQ